MKTKKTECNVAPDWIKAALDDIEDHLDASEPADVPESPTSPMSAPLGFV